MRPRDPEHASLADWRAVHAVDLDGTCLGCRYAIGAMRAMGSGSIINISSRSGLVGIPAAAAYASSRAAMRVLADQFEPVSTRTVTLSLTKRRNRATR